MLTGRGRPGPAMEPTRTVATCPLLSVRAGTPRHVVMAREALSPLVDMLRDDFYRSRTPTSSAARHPCCCLLDPLLLPAGRCSPHGVGSSLCPIENPSSCKAAAPSPQHERGWDGATLCSLSAHELDALAQSECELCASLRQCGAMQAELQQFSKRRTAALPAIRVVRCLLLGLRSFRPGSPRGFPSVVKPFPLRRLRRQQCKQGHYRAMRCRLGSPRAALGPSRPPCCCGKAAICLSPQPAQRGQFSRQAVRKWWCCPAGLGPVLGPNCPYMASCHFEPLFSLQVPARKQHPHPVLLDLWRRRPSRQLYMDHTSWRLCFASRVVIICKLSC